LSNISWIVGGEQLLTSGIVIFPGDESLLIKLKDGNDELSFEVVIRRPQSLKETPKLEFSGISETVGKLTFHNTTGPIGIGYQATLGTINNKKLTAFFRVINFAAMNELKYSFWVGPEEDG
jgi:hypothetical protein